MKTSALLIMLLSLAACSGKSGGSDEATSSPTSDSTPISDDSATGTTTGQTTGGATGSTAGGSTAGSTTGGTTGQTTGGTTGSTAGGSTGGSTTGSSTGGGTTGGVSDVPAEAKIWDADIIFDNFSVAQEDKVLKAVDMMKKVIASKEFKDAVINHTYGGKKTFVDNGGFTNAQIYQKILDGAEKMGNTSKNNRMDVELELYYSISSTIGYTYPNVTKIWMNTKYFNKYTSANVSGNLMHEWLHKLGFGHATSYSTARDYSVPYALGYLMEKLSKKYQ